MVYMKAKGVSVMLLTETHCLGAVDQCFVTPEGTCRVISTGLEDVHRQGVAFILCGDIPTSITRIRRSEKYPGRILALDVNVSGECCTLTGGYAPALKNDVGDIEAYGEFLLELEGYLGSKTRILLGDMNASIGTRDASSGGVIGDFGFEGRNERGVQMLQWCIRLGLVAANTHCADNDWSWLSPDDKTTKLLDYILVSENMLERLSTGGVYEDGPVLSDHRPVYGAFEWGAPVRRPKTKKHVRRDFQALRDREVNERYKRRCAEQCKGLVKSMDVNVRTEQLNNVVRTAAEEILPTLDTRPHAKYITEHTIVLINERNVLHSQAPRTEWAKKRINYLTRRVRRRLCAEREEYVTAKCDECESASRNHDLRGVFRVINELAGKSKSTGGSSVGSAQWVDHFKNLFTELTVDVEEGIFQRLSNVADSALAEKLRMLVDDGPPTKAELLFEMSRLSKRKASKDDLVVELFQEAGEECLDLIHGICGMIFEEGEWPSDWVESELLALYKGKGLLSDPNKYRGISLVAHASKIVCAVLRRRMQPVVDAQVGEYQCGFRPGRGTDDATLVYHMVSERIRDARGELHTAFIDFSKAFDSVNWELLFHILTIAGVPVKLVKVIRALYTQSSFRVRLGGGGVSEAICPTVGVRQGCILSPMFFILFLEFLIRLIPKLPIDKAVVVGRMVMDILGYADDLAFMATDFQALQVRVGQLDEIFGKVGMNVSIEKTEHMEQGARGVHVMRIRGEFLKKTARFPYLGVVQSDDASSEHAIQHRMGVASKVFRRLKSFWGCPMNTRVKGRLYETTIRRILLHGASTWTMRQADYRQLETFEMGCIRTVLKTSKIRRVPSVELRAKLGITTSIVDEVRRGRLRLFGHVSRMDGNRWGRVLLEEHMKGPPIEQRVGRPCVSWITCVKSDLESRNYGLWTGSSLARRDRNLYRKKVVYANRLFV